MARMFTADRHCRVERVVYRLGGIDPRRRPALAGLRALPAGVLARASVLLLYALLRLQAVPPVVAGHARACRRAAPGTPPCRFVTNTNWQWYSGESDAGLPRRRWPAWRCRTSCPRPSASPSRSRWSAGSPAPRTDRLGNFWVDLTRVSAADPAAARRRRRGRADGRRGGAELRRPTPTVTTLAGGTQTIPGGPVACQEAIKELGTNGGGFFNANSAHPFENPNALDEPARDLPAAGDPVQPAAHVRPDGRRHRARACAILAVMAGPVGRRGRGLRIVGRDGAPRARRCSSPARRWRARRSGSACRCRRCSPSSTTGTSTGAVNSMHDSLHRRRRRRRAAQHDARRGRRPAASASGLYGMLVARHPHGVPRRPDGRPHPGVPGQEDRPPRDHARRRSTS